MMARMARAWCWFALTVAVSANAARAQQLTSPAGTRISPALLPASFLSDSGEQTQAGCPQCTIPKKFGRGAWELIVVQLIPWSVNRFARDAEWAHISPSSWFRNFENPWQWDNNAFLNNQFSHPYHGSLYYNVGRSNGYNFFASSAWSFGGSLMWELMGEVWAPAPNDLLNTSLGGISLGEMLWRASSLVLDNQATGSERTFREIGGALLNPVRGFNRLIDGQTNDITQNPPDWRPSKNRASLDFGYRHTSGDIQGGPSASADQWSMEMRLDYGDPIDDLGKKPFSYLELTVGLGERVGSARTLQELRSRGSLAAKTLSQSEKSYHRLALYMTYDYLGQPIFEFGAQGFQGGLVSRFGKPEGLRLRTEVLGIVQPISALKSDYFTTQEGRDYDYGLSFGNRVLARLTKEGLGFAEADGTFLWTPILSGFNGEHTQLGLTLRAKAYPIGNRIGVGGQVTWYRRNSNYDTQADVTQSGSQSKLFVALSIPRWR